MLMLGFLSLVAIAAIVSLIFAAGLLRLHLAQSGASAPADSSPASAVPATQPAAVLPPAPANDPPAPDPLPTVPDVTIQLSAEKAKLSAGLQLEDDSSARKRPDHARRKGQIGLPDAPTRPHHDIIGWKSESQQAEWSANLAKPGAYEVDLVYSFGEASHGSIDYIVTIGDQELRGSANATRGGRENFQVATVGIVNLQPGSATLVFHLVEDNRRASLLRVRELRLIPAY
jgi:hypothetical protein